MLLELPRSKRTREKAGEIDDERPPERLHRTRTYHYPATALAERAAGAEEKRRLILDAAVRVFARKGFHTSRVGDIAEEAGVAHGLLYHYFSSKDEVLETIFRENWGLLVERINAVEAVRRVRAAISCAMSLRSSFARGGISRTSYAFSCARSRAARRCRSASATS